MGKRVLLIVVAIAVGMLVVFVLTKRGGAEPRVLWVKDLSANWVSPPAIGKDGTLYFGDLEDNLCAVARDGSELWKTPFPRQPSSVRSYFNAVLIGNDQRIYAVRLGELLAFGTNGQVRAVIPAGLPHFGAPAIGPDNTIYVGDNSNKLQALNADGSLRWEFTTGWWSRGNPAIGPDGTVLFQSMNNVYAFNPDGTLNWRCTNGGPFVNNPIAGPDGTVYVQCSTNFCAITPEGRVRWHIPHHTDHHSAVLDAAGRVYIAGHNGVTALEAATGKVLWRQEKIAMPFCGLALASDGTIYFSGLDSTIYGIDQKGKVKWSFRRERYRGAIGILERIVNRVRSFGRSRGKPYYPCGFTLSEENRLYAIMPDQKLYALEVPAGLATNAPWPMMGRDVRRASAAGPNKVEK